MDNKHFTSEKQGRLVVDYSKERGIEINVEGEVEDHISRSADIFERGAYVVENQVSGGQGVPAEISQALNAPRDSFRRRWLSTPVFTNLATSG